MSRLLLIYGLIMYSSAYTQDDLKRNIYYGNEYYSLEEYEDALSYFEEAIDESPLDFKANFNLANTQFRLGNYEKAGEVYTTIANLAPTGFDKSKVYHNLGNSLFMQQKLDDAIEAYKNGLRLNPRNENTRYNLAYALLLKQQQEQQQEQDQEQDQNSDENQNSDESQNGENGENSDQNNSEGDDGENEENGNNNEDENNPEDEEGNNSSEGDNDEGEEKDNGSNQQPNKISKEQARRILENAFKREKEVQKQIDQKKKVGTGSSSKKDW